MNDSRFVRSRFQYLCIDVAEQWLYCRLLSWCCFLWTNNFMHLIICNIEQFVLKHWTTTQAQHVTLQTSTCKRLTQLLQLQSTQLKLRVHIARDDWRLRVMILLMMFFLKICNKYFKKSKETSSSVVEIVNNRIHQR